MTRKAIYNYTKTHLLDWFPKLPSYQAFCRRLNRIAGAFLVLADIWMKETLSNNQDTQEYAVDSFPVILASRSNSTRTKVRKPLCNKCYNSTRQEWYHGIKVHVFCMLRPQKLPLPCAIQISNASLCELWAAKQIMLDLAPVSNGTLFADRVYVDASWTDELLKQHAIVLTPPRKKRPDDVLKSGDCLNPILAAEDSLLNPFLTGFRHTPVFNLLLLSVLSLAFSFISLLRWLSLLSFSVSTIDSH